MIFIQEKYCDCCGAWYKFETEGSPDPSYHCPTCGGNGRDLFILGTVATREIPYNGFLYNANKGNYKTCDILHTLSNYATFEIPDDFLELFYVKLSFIPNTSTLDVALYFDSHYAQPGEDYDKNAESDHAQRFDFTDKKIIEVDLTGIYSALEPGHKCGLKIENVSGVTIHILSMKIEYKLNTNSYNGS